MRIILRPSGEAAAEQRFAGRRSGMNKSKLQSVILRTLVYTAAFITFGVLICLIAYILIKGIPNLSLDLFSFEYNSENVSLFPALINTVVMTALSLVIAVPLGVFSAIYLVEYAKRGNKIVGLIRLTAETLSGIPSIVYGLFGFLLFVTAFSWGYSLLAGAFTLVIMILPVIMRTTEEALKAVPDTFREGSFGLGAGKLRTVFKIVLPSAVPGILAGVVLSVGRIGGRDCGFNLYSRNSSSDSERFIRFRKNPRCTYVRSVERGAEH